MKTMMSIYDVKAHFSEVIARVEETGEALVVCRHNRPVADIVPHRSVSDPLKPDPKLKGAVFHGDPAEPLPGEDWPEALR